MTKKLLSLFLLSVPTMLVAQTARERIRTLDTLEVQAKYRNRPVPEISRTNVPLDQLPLTISLVDMKAMEKRNLFELNEVSRFVTAGSFYKTFGGFLKLNVRGFDGTPVFIDGVREERSLFHDYPMSDLSDAESVEVLKGAGSVLSGQSAVGGFLNITRLSATSKRKLDARLNYGSWNKSYGRIVYGDKISKHWNALGMLSTGLGEGWRSQNNKRFKAYATVNGHWAKDNLDIRASYNRDFYGTEAGLPPLFWREVYNLDNSVYMEAGQIDPKLKLSTRYNNESDEMWHKAWNVSAKWQHKFSQELKLNEYASFANDNVSYFAFYYMHYPSSKTAKKGFNHYIIDDKGEKVYYDLAHIVQDEPSYFERKAKTFQNQLSLDAQFNTGFIKHKLTFGYDFSFMRRVSYTGYDVSNKDGSDIWGPDKNSKGFTYPIIDAYEPNNQSVLYAKYSIAEPEYQYSNGIFVNDVWEFSKELHLMTALRYDYYDYRSSGELPIRDGKYDFDDSKEYDKTTSQALTYRLGLVYQPIEQINLYGSVANYYRPYRDFYDPKTIYLDYNGEEFEAIKGGSVFKPRTGYQVEVGARLNPTKWLELSSSIYYIKQFNEVKTLGKKTVKVNGADVEKRIKGQVGTTESLGLELSMRLNPLNGLHFEGGYSYTDVHIAKIRPNKYVASEDLEGKQLTIIPKNQFYLLGDYEVQKGLFKGFDTHLSLSYIGERSRDLRWMASPDSNASKFNMAGYTQLDLGFSYKFLKNHLTLGFDLYNLLNDTTYQMEVDGSYPIPSKPLNFMVSLRYSL